MARPSSVRMIAMFCMAACKVSLIIGQSTLASSGPLGFWSTTPGSASNDSTETVSVDFQVL